MLSMDNNLTEIFVDDAVNIDCAVLIPGFGPIGKSWAIDINWKGTLDDEGVVFDFSLAKKSAKEVVEKLLDHKILVSKDSVKKINGERLILLDKCGSESSYFAVNTYSGTLAILEREVLDEIKDNNTTNKLEKIIEDEILKNSLDNIKEVTVRLKEHSEKENTNFFSYTHSLKNHFGNCQKFHGHSNVIRIFNGAKFDSKKSEEAAKLLNNRYIVNESYVQKDTNSILLNELYSNFPVLNNYKDSHYTFEYSGTKGDIALIMPVERTLLLEGESTIEYLSKFILNQLNLKSDYKVFAYEGFKKGAIS